MAGVIRHILFVLTLVLFCAITLGIVSLLSSGKPTLPTLNDIRATAARLIAGETTPETSEASTTTLNEPATPTTNEPSTTTLTEETTTTTEETTTTTTTPTTTTTTTTTSTTTTEPACISSSTTIACGNTTETSTPTKKYCWGETNATSQDDCKGLACPQGKCIFVKGDEENPGHCKCDYEIAQGQDA
ncbi:Uncharacterised protein [uncultured archaeon]|nr:Uncharacterised protein [uncultured archaeon]